MTENQIKSPPLVSIILPAYNYGRYLLRALDSIRDQSYKNIEICLTNDGSTDDSDQVVRRFIDDNPDIRFVYVVQENKGLSAARNAAIAQSRGEYLCFLDADDALKPECVETLLDYSKKYPAAEIISGGCEVMEFDPHGNLTAQAIFRNEKTGFLLPRQAFGRLFYQNVLGMISVLVEKKAFDRAGRFDQGLKSCEDLDFWLRASRKAPLLLVPEVLGIVYKYPEGLSRDPHRLYSDMTYIFRRNKEYLFRNYPGPARAIYRKALVISHLIALNLYRSSSTKHPFRWLYHLLGVLIYMPALIFSRQARKRLQAERTGLAENPHFAVGDGNNGS